MQKFIPRQKLSKRKKKELDAQKRTTWESISPVTRTVDSKKLYSRKNARKKPAYTEEYPVHAGFFAAA